MCEFGESGTWEVSLVGTSVEGGRTTRFVRSYIVVENQEAFVDVYVYWIVYTVKKDPIRIAVPTSSELNVYIDMLYSASYIDTDFIYHFLYIGRYYSL